MDYAVIILLGLAVGSFINVAAARIQAGESLWKPPSHCRSCRERLGAADLVPVLSYLLLKGRCRFCAAAIPLRYPLVEIAAATVFVVCYSYFGLGLFFWKYVVIFVFLLLISVIDLEHNIVPNRLVLLVMAWMLLWQFAGVSFLTLESSLIGFLVGGALFYAIAYLSRGGMGAGDVKLMAVIGFGIGWPYITMVFLMSFILGGLIGSVLLLAGRKTRRSALAFAPFVSVSHFVVTFWGVDLWKWYVSYF